MLAIMLAGCGSDPETVDVVVVEQPQAAPSSACAASFDPSKIASGDDCAPKSGAYCPQGNNGLVVLQPNPIPCDGVTVSTHAVNAAGLSSDYLALHGNGSFDAIYLALHYLGANTGTFANVARLPELAKARRVLVIVPQAPSPPGLSLTSRWPVNPQFDPVDQYVHYLDAVVSDARERFSVGDIPVYVAGLSNGAVMAYHYACRSGVPSAIEAVAGDISDTAFSECAPSHAVSSVIVHGTADVVTPYEGLLGLTASIPQVHSLFRNAGGCSLDDTRTAMPKVEDPLLVTIFDSGVCGDRSRHLLVKVDGGGHTWPGHPQGETTNLSMLGLLGPRTANFDATLQGFDLLRLSATR
ncbi:hypothetical protein E4T66_08855 [Sinimarinibacterium sp. CAU 1509]|uniref:alpha/beta hydrolase family esterase n=1 Tax=Sinimarinibacterium sp. CAU 1509 TaxID=2562283 RepID=UPI0010ACBBBA|nr:hypothetical protein [Sinimarinibacterium sp. CAU 1509]TJY62314.1 hypothetical protein E4T66_08855 [Sinimarinibacterium sp. CAU 1509]